MVAERLANSGDPVSVIAPLLGYASENAFRTAFKRVMGSFSKEHGRRRQPTALSRRDGNASYTNGLQGKMVVMRKGPPCAAAYSTASLAASNANVFTSK